MLSSNMRLPLLPRSIVDGFPHMSLTINPPSRLSAEDYIYNIETLVTPYDYNPIGDQTFCNRYAFYAMKECNANLPTKSDGVTPGNCQEMYDELITNQYSKWRITDFAEAQHRANLWLPHHCSFAKCSESTGACRGSATQQWLLLLIAKRMFISLRPEKAC